jgi:hypothetical protein
MFITGVGHDKYLDSVTHTTILKDKGKRKNKK